MASALALAASLLACAPAAYGAPVRLAQIGDFAAPVYVAAPLGDTSRVFVVEQGGTIQLVRDGRKSLFADLSGPVLAGGERGLLSLAFAPDYATSGLFYVYYTADSPAGAITIEERRRDAADPDRADPGYARLVLRIPHSRSNHNGGQLQFGPDGALYAGTGDGGGSGDPDGNGQRLTGSKTADGPNPLLGKLLRIDPRGAAPYAIPAGQPALGGAEEIWAYGLRNPWRFSFDRARGDLFIADVGQGAYEEVDIAPAPGGPRANYGWSAFEGDRSYPGGAPAQPPPGISPPAIVHAHAEGWASITGGYVVRDPALAELEGRYVYGDYGKGDLHAATPSGAGAAGDAPIGLHVDALSSFGEDGCGRVYVASLNGPVSRLATTGACAGPAPFVGLFDPGRPPAVPAGADTTAPVVSLTAARRQRALRKGYLAVRATCSEDCSVRASARVAVTRRRPRSAKASLAAGARVALKLRLGPRTRRAIARSLRRGRRATARITVTAADPAGNRRTARVAVRIVRRR